jgi:CubicO group peptidase (beta-lactamase class C family)
MVRQLVKILTFGLVGITISLFGQKPFDQHAVDRYLAQMVETWDVPSMAVGVVKDGQLIFTKSYGTKEVGKNEIPNSETLYAIASNSKAFTSALIALLVQEGKINWDDKVQKYLPYFQIYDPYLSTQVTIRDLLCHRVGLGTFSGDVIWYKSDFSAEEIIKRIKHLSPVYDFRSGFGYSNLMFITAGEIIRTVTGKSWADNLQERIFDVIGMNRSIVGPALLLEKGNYATPHELENHSVNKPIPWADWTTVAATGGIISSVNDMAKWMIFNLNNGVWQGDTILSKSSRNTMWTLHNNYGVDRYQKNEFNTHFSGYGLGWNLRDYDGNLFVGHTGGYDGMLTSVSLIPDKNIGVVVLTNGMKSPFMAATYYLVDAMLGREEIDWSTKLLSRMESNVKADTRIADRQRSRVAGTHPSLDLSAYAGIYLSDIHGEITISEQDDHLRMEFKHAPAFSANLDHWHYDVFQIKWDQPSAWFSFGTVKFNFDNNLKITSIDFDVPNDDIFFDELNPIRMGG